MNPIAHHILIVEDEAEIRRFVRLTLQSDGHTVHEADSLQRGLIEAGTRRPDLVVLDLGLPDGDGVTQICFGDFCLDLARRTVERGSELLHLTPIEYKLLTQLASQPDRVVTHQQLLKAVWGPGHAEDSHYVRVHMANLRKKIEARPSQPRHLITESGIGYRFVV